MASMFGPPAQSIWVDGNISTETWKATPLDASLALTRALSNMTRVETCYVLRKIDRHVGLHVCLPDEAEDEDHDTEAEDNAGDCGDDGEAKGEGADEDMLFH